MTVLQIDFPSRVTVGMQTENRGPIRFEFIWGVGTEGLTDFELALARVPQGESVSLSLRSNAVKTFFGHLASHVTPLSSPDREIQATARIEQVEPVSNREVVKAIAGLNEDSCGCGGGDGCGCH